MRDAVDLERDQDVGWEGGVDIKDADKGVRLWWEISE
jgi:hypothetical protein